MANIDGGTIGYSIEYHVDQSGLKTVENQLRSLSNMSNEDLLKLNPGKDEKELKEIKDQVKEIRKLYSEAFDYTTGEYNLTKIKKSLNELDTEKLYNNLSQYGSAGVKVFRGIANQASQVNLRFRETNSFLSKMGETFVNTVKWSVASSVINRFTSSIQEAWGYVKHLDTSLNDIRIVTGKSAEEMENFAVKANNAAKALGSSTTEYTEAALIYYQQGLSDEESQARAETTLKAANVTGQTGREVSEELTAVWNGYKVTAEETEEYVDKLAAVAATTASDLEELSKGMSKVASAANNMGVDIDQLNAQLSTIISVTRQAPETAGTALKTIYARIEDLKLGGTDEDGIKLGQVSGGLSSLGIEIKNSQGDLRDLGEVIEEVGLKWESWTESQQSAIAQLIAGKRQYNNLLALFDNWDMYTKALDTSTNAVGTLQNQQNIYLESTEAHLQQLSTEWEDLYDSLFDTKDVNSLVDGFTKILDTITSIVDSLGGGKGVLLGLVATLTKIGPISNVFSNEISNIITKSQNAKLNMSEWSQYIQASKKYLTESSPLYQERLKILNQLEQQNKNMTDEEKKQTVEQLTQLNLLSDQLKTTEKQVNVQKDFLQNSAQAILDNSSYTSAEDDPSSFEFVAGLSKDKEEGEKQLNSQEGLQASKSVLEEESVVLDQAETAWKEYQQSVKDAIATKENLESTGYGDLEESGVGEAIVSKVETAKEKLKGFLTVLGPASEEEINNLINSLDESFKVVNEGGVKELDFLKEYLEDMSEDIETSFSNVGEKIDEAYEVVDKKQKEQLEAAKKLAEKAEKDRIAANQKIAQGITGVASSVSSLAFSIQAVRNLGGIWSNEDLSLGEKIFQTVTNVATSLPMLLSGISSFGESVRKIKEGAAASSNAVEAALEAEAAANAANTAATEGQAAASEQAAAGSVSEASANNVASGALEEETGQEIINEEVKKKNAGVTQLLTNKLKSLWETMKANKVASASIALAAFSAIVIEVVKSIRSYHAEIEATQASNMLQISEDNLEKAKELNSNVEKLTESYKSLKEQVQKQEITFNNLKQSIYETANEYDIQIDTVQVLTANYKELDDIINKVNADAAQAQTVATQKNIEAKERNLVAQGNAYMAENDSLVSDTVLGLGSNSELYLEALAVTGPDEKIITDEFGNFDWQAFYDASEETQSQIISLLQSYADGWNSRAQDALNFINENQGTWDEIKASEEDFKSQTASNILDQIIADEGGINTVSQLNSIKDQLTQQISTELQISLEEAKEIAEKEIASNEDLLKVNASIQLATDVGEGLGIHSEEGLNDLANKISKLNLTDITYIENNKALLAAEGDLDEFLKHTQNIRDQLKRKENSLTVSVALEGVKKGELKQEDIDSLFEDSTFAEDNRITKEEFEALDNGDQIKSLIDYYVVLNQKISENKDETINSLEEQKNKVQEYRDIVEQFGEDWEKKGVKLQSIAGDHNFIDKTVADVTSGVNEIAKIRGEAQITEEEARQAMSDYYNAKNKEELDAETKLNIEKIKEAKNLTDEQIDYYGKLIVAQEDYHKKTAAFNKDRKSYADLVNALNEEENTLTNNIEEQEEVLKNWDWATALSLAQEEMSNINKSIDSLQTAYKTLQSVVTDYNDSQTLTMDNLQSLLEMDSQYLSALQIENGQMTINTNTLKAIALSKLDEAEATAYETAMVELGLAGQEKSTDAVENNGAATENLTIQLDKCTTALAGGAAAWDEYWKSMTQSSDAGQDKIDEVGEALYNKLTAIESVKNEILNTDNFATVMATGSNSSSSSSSSNDPSSEEYLERDKDLYREINEELENTESILSRIQTINDHSWGETAKKALEDENDLLNDQLDLYEEKAEISAKDLASQRAALEEQGVEFNSDGSAMTNSEEVLDNLYAEYNAMVDSYNSMTKDEQNAYESTLSAKKETIENIEDAMDDYEDSYSDYNDIMDDLLDTHYDLIANAVNQFNADVDVQLELDEAKDEWTDFWYDVIEDVDDTDFGGMVSKSLSKLDILTGDNGQISYLTTHVAETVAEVNKQIAAAAEGGGDSLFGDDTALSEETLTKYRDNLITAVKNAKTEIDNMASTYQKALEDQKNTIDEQIEGLETVGDHLKHNIDLIKLVSGEKAYDAIGKQYEKYYENDVKLVEANKISMDHWKDQMDYYQQQMATQEEGSKMYKVYSDAFEEASKNYKDAVDDLDSSLEEGIKRIQEAQKNELAALNQALDKDLSEGLGLERIKNQWDLAIESQERFLDNIERSMGMEELKGEFDDILKDMDLRGAKQQEFLKFQDEELKRLNEREKLTQFDIDELKARLEIKKQELALEEAQQNKTNLRLRRDSQGNYTYQYTANEDAVDEAEGGLLTAKREWYELVKNRNKEVSEEVLDIRSRMAQAEQDMADATLAHDTDAYNKAHDTYVQLQKDMVDVMGNAENAKKLMLQGTDVYFADVMNNKTLRMWDTAVQSMIDKWSGDGEDSFITSTENAITKLTEITETYSDKTKTLLDTAGVNYKNLKDNGIDPTTDSLEKMTSSNNDLKISLDTSNTSLREMENELKGAIDGYNKLKTAASDAIDSANKALNTLADTAVTTKNTIETTANAAASIDYKSLTSNGTNAAKASSESASTDDDSTKYETTGSRRRYDVKKVSPEPQADGRYKVMIFDKKYGYTVLKTNNEDATPIRLNAASGTSYSGLMTEEEIKQWGEKTYKSGGYTGDWNQGIPGTDNGRLAVLHQKELVLNEADTSNMLSAISALRDIVKMNNSAYLNSLSSSNSIAGQLLAGIGSAALQTMNSITNNSNSQNNNVVINADFSNVRSADEIYQALIELQNYGAQESYSVAPYANMSY